MQYLIGQDERNGSGRFFKLDFCRYRGELMVTHNT